MIGQTVGQLSRLIPRSRAQRMSRPARSARPVALRARGALLIGLALVVMAHVGMNIVMDTIRPELRDPEFGCRLEKIHALQSTHPDRPMLVALGSSRTQMGLVPGAMSLCDSQGREVIAFNFGAAGCGPVGQWINLNRLLSEEIRPDYVLIEVLPPSLHMDGDGPDFIVLSRMSPADLRVLRPYCSDPETMYNEWAELRMTSLSTTRFNLMCKLMPGWVPFPSRVDYLWDSVDSHGWLPYPYPDVTEEKRAEGVTRTREEYRDHMRDFHISELPDRALRDLLRTCQQRGIPTALYLMPEGPSFRSNYPPEAQLQIDAYLDALSREYAVPLFDARDWIDENHFSDGHHLLPGGARQFSERFAERLRGWLEADGK